MFSALKFIFKQLYYTLHFQIYQYADYFKAIVYFSDAKLFKNLFKYTINNILHFALPYLNIYTNYQYFASYWANKIPLYFKLYIKIQLNFAAKQKPISAVQLKCKIKSPAIAELMVTRTRIELVLPP